jgi:hypothetical protein
MTIQDTVFFDTDELIEGKTSKLTYRGFLAEKGAEEIYVHFGFGLLWDNLQEIKLTKTANGFEADIEMQSFDDINFCFRDNFNNWDNNNCQNYSAPIRKDCEVIAKIESTAIDVPRLRRTYIIAKKIKLAFYKVITFLPKVFSGEWKKKRSKDGV